MQYVVKTREHGAKGWSGSIICNNKTDADATAKALATFDREAIAFVRVAADRGPAYIPVWACEDIAREFGGKSIEFQPSIVSQTYAEPLAGLFAAIVRNDRIQAIKNYRLIAGCTLEEAMDNIEMLLPRKAMAS